MRLPLILTSMLGINDMYLSTKAFSYSDSLFLIALLYYAYRVSSKIRLRIKKRQYIFISILIVFLTNGFDTNYLEEHYYFSDPILACNYSTLCEIRSTMIFIEGDYAIFPDESNYIEYYPHLKKGWKIDNTLYKQSFYAKHDKFELKIYKVGSKYFVYLLMNEIMPIDNIVDNSDKDFVALKGGYYSFSISDRFGKLIDSIEDYKISINGEEIEIKKV